MPLDQQVATVTDPALHAAAAYADAKRRWHEAEDAADECFERAEFPEVPSDIRIDSAGGRMTVEEAVRVAHDKKDILRRLALIEEHKAACDEVLERFGYNRLRAEADAASEENDRLMKVLRDTRATTPAGMLAKMRIAIGMEEEGFAEEMDPDSTYVAPAMFSSVFADLKRLAETSHL